MANLMLIRDQLKIYYEELRKPMNRQEDFRISMSEIPDKQEYSFTAIERNVDCLKVNSYLNRVENT